MTDSIDLTIVMPCLNEAETLGACIENARFAIKRSGARGKILVADNGREDDSVQIAEKLGARFIHVKEKDTATWRHSSCVGDCDGRRRKELRLFRDRPFRRKISTRL